jgi:hypothetical protein
MYNVSLILSAAMALWPPLQPNLVKIANALAAPLRRVNEDTE